MDSPDPDPDRAPTAPGWNDPGRALQMLSTEHWSLLSARSLAWNEAFARSGLYLTVLSASVVALALVAQATDFDGRFAAFAVVLMSVVFFVGVTTVVRLNQSNVEDALWAGGMNRIRHAYVEMEPRLQLYLVTSPYDDPAGVLASMGVPAGREPRAAHMFVTTPGMLAVVNSVVGGVIAGIGLAALGTPVWLAVVVSVAVFVVVLVAMLAAATRGFVRLASSVESRFPSPPA